MKVCVTRNAEARTNAAIARIANALEYEVAEICLLTRNRFTDKHGRVTKLGYVINDKSISNYEIGLKSEPGKGLTNIFQLFIFQFLVWRWFVRNKEKYDVIHAFDLDTGLPALISSIITRKKYVYHIADFYADSRKNLPKSLRSLIRKLEYLVINKSETTIICTEERKNQIEGSNPKKVVVVHNTPSVFNEFLSTITSEKNKKVTKDDIILTYVGGLTEGRFIKSAIDVIKKYPKVTLNLAGMGRLAEYAEKAANEFENINYYGMIDYNHALELYSQTDYMFAIYDPNVPNHKYSAPNKVYEAMLLSKPIIVAKGTGIDEIVSKNSMGIVMDYNTGDFEEIIVNLIENPSLKYKFAQNSKDAYPRYSWNEMKKRIINIYRDIETNY